MRAAPRDSSAMIGPCRSRRSPARHPGRRDRSTLPASVRDRPLRLPWRYALGAVHGLAHALGLRLGIPHGLVCAILLPHTLRFNFVTARERYDGLKEALGAVYAALQALDCRPREPTSSARGPWSSMMSV